MNRTESKSFARLLRRATDPARSAGTVMLLVVGVLLLVLIVGMTYMHVVQEDRRAGLTVDIDAIVLAQADLVAVKLVDDLGIKSTGQHFALDARNNATGAATADGIVDEEPYDYPGPLDKWLAATSPEGASTSWSQVSLLGEAFWNGTDSSTDTTQTLTATNAVGTSKASNGAADADGDGIIDSKPEEAAIATRGGLVFYAWTRVEDMSSKANINVWHSQISSAGAYDADMNAPRFWYPGELDLGGLVYAFTSVNAQYTNVMTADMPGLMAMRGVSGTLPTPWGIATAGRRGNSWLASGKFYGNPQGAYASLHLDSSGSFDPTNELELRHRNGLVYLDREAGIEASGRARNLLRGNVTSAETAWNDSVPGVSSIANYFTNEPRHQLTTYSGASIYRIPMSGDSSTPFYGKRDINQLLTGASPAAALASEIAKVYGSAPVSVLPPSTSSAAIFADQFAANIVDFADDDNQLTPYNGRYGMEALPFICEVYTQGEYAIAAGAADNGDGTWDVTWELQGVAGFVIEIRNPFRKPIKLTDVHLVIGGTDWGDLSVLAGGKMTLAPDEKLMLYRNDGGGTNAVTNLYATDPDLTNVAAAGAGATNAWPTNDGDVVVELRAEDQAAPATLISYSKTLNAYGVPATITEASFSSGADPAGTQGWRYGTSLGNGDRLNTVTIQPSQFVADGRQATPATVYAPTEQLKIRVKANGPSGTIPTAELDRMQLIYADATNLGAASEPPIKSIAELYLVPVIGPSSTLTFAEQWGAATSSEDFLIDWDSSNTVSSSVDYDVPHAVLLVDRLTTLSPREDSVDNDGDGNVDESDELFVPGAINLNTAPEFMLDRILPIASGVKRLAAVDAILAYRDETGTNPRTASTYRNGRKGIAYVGEMINLGTLVGSLEDASENGNDNLAVGGVTVDFLSNPTTGGDGIIDDAEEVAFIVRWLAQTCSTRSDVYCAYILVRGYTPGNLMTPVTERRAAVLLDRSRVVAEDDGVRVLGIIWY